DFHDVNTSPDLDSIEQSRDRTSSWSESGGDSEDDMETFSNESPETSSTESTAWIRKFRKFPMENGKLRKSWISCETILMNTIMKRKEEARQALACTEYVELANGKRRKKVGVRSVPPDPRPFDVRLQEFYDVSGKLAEEDILDGADGKLSSEDVKALKDQLILIEVDSRNTSLSTDIEKWEKHINAVTGGRPKITIVNEVDTSGPPIGFEFRNEYVAGDGVSIPTDPLGCDCEMAIPVVTMEGPNVVRVKVRQGNPIYECNSKCNCGPECANRVVQDGKSDHKLCIFRTSNGCGWGVKSLKSIKKGTFVTLYVGEVIKSDEAERRGKDYDELQPNLGVYAVWVDCLDVNLPKLAMFA
ncbi:Histone-lysine N-methyltransferase SUV39H2, partial [Orchesella cincta]